MQLELLHAEKPCKIIFYQEISNLFFPAQTSTMPIQGSNSATDYFSDFFFSFQDVNIFNSEGRITQMFIADVRLQKIFSNK